MNGEQKEPLIQEIKAIRDYVGGNHNYPEEKLQEFKEQYDTLINTRIPAELTRILLDEIEPLGKEIQTLQEASALLDSMNSALLDSMNSDDNVIPSDFLKNTALQVAVTLSSTSVKAPTFPRNIELVFKNSNDATKNRQDIDYAVSALKDMIAPAIEELNARLKASYTRKLTLLNAERINPSHFRIKSQRHLHRTTIPTAAESQNKRVDAAEQKRREARQKQIENRRRKRAAQYEKLIRNKRTNEVFRRLTESI